MEEDTELDEVRLSRLKAELDKARRKRDEERRYKEAENTCIHEMVHAACLSPEQLAELIRAASNGMIPGMLVARKEESPEETREEEPEEEGFESEDTEKEETE